MKDRESEVRARLLELARRGAGDKLRFEDEEEYERLLEELSSLVKDKEKYEK